jgi:hypothetical protein
MEQVLSIHTVPMSFEMRVNEAQLTLPPATDPTHELAKRNSSLSISHSYPGLRMDTYEARSSMGLKSAFRASEEMAADSMQIALEATAEIAQQGNSLMEFYKGVTIGTIETNRYFQNVENELACKIGAIPSVPVDINWSEPQLSMQYDPEELYFDWNTSDQAQAEFTPASVDFIIKEFSHVEIEFIGKPIYVPPSASPDYEPPKFSKVV